ncbi:MAG: hypothetical protein HZB66_01135 [Candidatus Aenigmarchaeota archaeon]|nr:hypothetical protein [Candidatus Aenigmarchaeota archaeon]
MVTVSHLVKKYVEGMPFIHECMGKKILNYASVAELLKPGIEKEMEKKIKTSAIMMALRRYAEDIERKYESGNIMKILSKSEISIRSSLCDITVFKSGMLFGKLKNIYNIVDYDKGDILNIVHGNFTVTIIVNEAHRKKILDTLENDKVYHVERDLAQVSLKFPSEYLYTSGVLHQLTKELAWNNVNLIEIVSSLTELNFIVKNKDTVKAYSALENMIERSKEMVK